MYSYNHFTITSQGCQDGIVANLYIFYLVNLPKNITHYNKQKTPERLVLIRMFTNFGRDVVFSADL